VPGASQIQKGRPPAGAAFFFRGLIVLRKPEAHPDDAISHRRCSKCKALRSLTEFNFKQRAEGIRHPYCRDCGKELTRSHYRRRKRLYLDRNLRAYNERRLMVIAAKSRPCVDCGVQYPYYVMDFDHREGVTKEFSLHRVQNATKRAILREIAKCDVVCANCHRERTYQRVMQKVASRL
jgi:hypothetical protein